LSLRSQEFVRKASDVLVWCKRHPTLLFKDRPDGMYMWTKGHNAIAKKVSLHKKQQDIAILQPNIAS